MTRTGWCVWWFGWSSAGTPDTRRWLSTPGPPAPGTGTTPRTPVSSSPPVRVLFAVVPPAAVRSSGVLQAVVPPSTVLLPVVQLFAVPSTAVRSSAFPQVVVRSSAVLQAAVRSSAALEAAVRFSAALEAAVRSSAALEAAVRSSAVLQAAVRSSAAPPGLLGKNYNGVRGEGEQGQSYTRDKRLFNYNNPCSVAEIHRKKRQ